MHRVFQSRPARRTAVMILVALASGCGQDGPDYPTAVVEGSVTVAGQPLPDDAEGTVTFMPAAGGGQAPPVSSPLVDGRYRLDDAPLGKVNVLFNITRLTGRMVREDNIPTAAPHAERETLVPVSVRGGVAVEINGDESSRNFDL